MKGIAETIKNIGYKKLIFYYGFLLMLAAYLARLFLDTTSWGLGWSDRTYLIFAVICGAFVAVKAIFYDKWTPWEAIGAILIAAVCILSYMHSHYRYVLDIAILIIGCKGIQFKTVVRIYLYVGGFLLAVTAIACICGIVPDFINYKDDHIRHAFGSVYTTVFAAHIFYYVLAFRYLNKDDFKWFYYLIFIGLAVFIYKFCIAETSTICILGFTTLIFIYDLVNRYTGEGIKKIFNGFADLGGFAAMPAMCGFSLFAAMNYQNHPKLQELNLLVGSRLGLGLDAINNYGIKLFGSNFEMTGGDTWGTGQTYNFVDNSFMYVLVRYGSIVLIMALICYLIIVLRSIKSKDHTVSLIVLAMAVHCFMEQYIVEFSHVFILMYLFSKIGNTEDELVEKADGYKWPFLLNMWGFGITIVSLCMAAYIAIAAGTGKAMAPALVAVFSAAAYGAFLLTRIKKRYFAMLCAVITFILIRLRAASAIRDVTDMILMRGDVPNLIAFAMLFILIGIIPFILLVLRENRKGVIALISGAIVLLFSAASIYNVTGSSSAFLIEDTDTIIKAAENLRSGYPDRELTIYAEEFAYTASQRSGEAIYPGEPDRNIENLVYIVPSGMDNTNMRRTGRFTYTDVNSRFGYYTNITN